MIELIYNEEGESTTEERTLPEPKNVKQVGEPKDYKKIFIEDYVHTFLQQYSTGKESGSKIAILLGKNERAGGKRHLYVNSAFPVEQFTEKQGKYCFTEKMWGNIYQECEKYFPEQEILGWFLSKPGFPIEKTAVIEETHRTYFSGADKVLFMMEPLEQDSGFFGFDGNRFARQSGYYIYYEKNVPMREFLMEKNDGKKEQRSNETPDLAVANFRKILQEKQAKHVKRKKQALAYGMKMAVALVFLAGAVTLKNQTDKIQTMEQQKTRLSGQETAQKTSEDEVVVEELPGKVEENQETYYDEPMMSDEQDEELPVTEETKNPAEEISEEPEETVGEETAQETSDAPIDGKESEPAEETAADVPTYEEYRVQAGDTLAKICRERYGTDEMIEQICALNKIPNGDYIQEGEIILLP